ncbi:FliM/FliN family flagellar motor switch protein [Paludibacterium denitrificans]|uniref:FliM/FliN family flagellar motor switch protein n=1 Tax=Paludibacterium denitrificans TaxID=2675226 RepID=UPI002477D6A8|nr:FliM/FliN family flagellar motor switch protein [Paludibacterium denitrificans]
MSDELQDEQVKAAAPEEEISMDDWAAAMAEQADADASLAASDTTAAEPAHNLFQEFGATAESSGSVPRNLDMILDIPVQLTVELGRTKIAIRNLLQLAQGSVVELDGLAGGTDGCAGQWLPDRTRRSGGGQ